MHPSVNRSSIGANHAAQPCSHPSIFLPTDWIATQSTPGPRLRSRGATNHEWPELRRCQLSCSSRTPPSGRQKRLDFPTILQVPLCLPSWNKSVSQELMLPNKIHEAPLNSQMSRPARCMKSQLECIHWSEVVQETSPFSDRSSVTRCDAGQERWNQPVEINTFLEKSPSWRYLTPHTLWCFP